MTSWKLHRVVLITGLVAAISVHGLLLWIYHVPAPKKLWGDEQMYWQAAQSVLSEGRAGLDLLWPPLYPWFVAGWLVLGGGSILSVQIGQTLLLVALAWLVRDLASRFAGRGFAADLAGLLVVIDPSLVAFAHYLWPDVLFLALFFFAVWILAARPGHSGWLALMGIVLGLGLLTKSLLGPFLPVLLLPLALRGTLGERLLRVALVGGVLFLTVLPVMLSNFRRSGEFMIADSSRFNLWVGLNDGPRKNFVAEIAGKEYERYLESGHDYRARENALGHEIRERMKEKGVPSLLLGQLGKQYFRLLDRDSFLTEQLPGGDMHRQGAGYREVPWLAGAVLRYFSYAVYAAVLILGTAGMILLPPGKRPWLLVLLAFVAYNLALFLLLHVKTRYRLTFLPVFYIYASCLASYWLGVPPSGPEAPHPRSGPLALGAASFAALLLVFLAFGGRYLD